MKSESRLGRSRRWSVTAAGALALLTVSCSSEETPKAWNAFATCLAGKAAASPIGERVKALRLVQVANASANAADKEAWPKRCAARADALFATLSSSDYPVLRRQLGEQLHCNETAGSCRLPEDKTLINVTTTLWEAATASKLETAVSTETPSPAVADAPLFDSKSWKSISPKPTKFSGPVLTPDGRGVLVFKGEEGRARPSACEFSDDFAKVRCLDGNAGVPELPVQSIEAVRDPKGVFAAGLTDEGLFAYDLDSGAKSDVRGRSGQLLRDGLVVEKGVKDDVGQEPPSGLPGKGKGKGRKGKPDPKAKGGAQEAGFVAVELSAGKASKELKLPLADLVGEPIAVGNQVAHLTSGGELALKSVNRGRLKDVARVKGNFVGAFHTCQLGARFALATFGGRSNQPSAKPTAGADKTQFTFTVFDQGAWSKSAETTLPFDRAYESPLVCTSAGASVTWARSASGGIEIGRVDCSADGCKASQATLPGVASTWWWAVAPIGDKVVALWRGALGETRLRFGTLSELPNVKDVLVFDSPDYGGAAAGEVTLLNRADAALLLFRGEQPVALRVGSDGAPRLLTR